MLSDYELDEMIEDLGSPKTSMRVATLEDLRQDPSKDPRVLPYLERLLKDTTPGIVMLPYRFGEIRWLAAHALAAERAALGIKEPVRLQGVVRPLSTEEFVAIRNKVGIEVKGGIEGVLKSMHTLREIGKLPLYDLELET
jgi:hypothetical protein